MEPKKQKVITYFFKKENIRYLSMKTTYHFLFFPPCAIDIEDCDHESHPLKNTIFFYLYKGCEHDRRPHKKGVIYHSLGGLRQ